MSGLNSYVKYASFGISWVLTTCVYLYLGYKGGQWLDARWETEPLFLGVCLLVGLLMSVTTLVKELLALTDADTKPRRSATGNKNAGDSEKNNFLNVGGSDADGVGPETDGEQESDNLRGRNGRLQ